VSQAGVRLLLSVRVVRGIRQRRSQPGIGGHPLMAAFRALAK